MNFPMAEARAARVQFRLVRFLFSVQAMIWRSKSRRSLPISWKLPLSDLELVDGAARIVGTDREISFASIAKAAEKPEDVSGFGEFKQDEATYPNGTHVCEVEIDPDTGITQVVGYTQLLMILA